MSQMYDLTCTSCSFTAVVEGDTDDVYDAIEAHQDDSISNQEDHFVDVEMHSPTKAQS